MGKLQTIFYLALAILIWTGQGQANEIWPQKVKVGGEFRTRVEARLNDNLDNTNGVNDVFVLLRTRVYLDAHPGEGVRIFGMFQNSETLGQDSLAIFKTPDRTQFYQGFVSFTTKGKLTTRLKMGRQELNYGEQRLIGAFDWGNLGRSFDGAVLRLENEGFWLDLFGTRIKIGNNEAQLAAGYGHLNHFFNGSLEPYIIVYHGDHIGNNGEELSLVTIGTRIIGKVGEHWDYGFEGAYQTGKNAGELISAYALHTDFGYTFHLKPKPRVGFEFNYASGDADPTSGTVTLFNNILPTNHNKYGYIDYFSWRNMIDISTNFVIWPYSFMKAYLGYHAFFLPEPANGVFAASGAQFRAGAPGASPYAGQEIDLLFVFKPWKYFDALAGYSVFFPGNFFSDTGTSDVSHFAYAQFLFHY